MPWRAGMVVNWEDILLEERLELLRLELRRNLCREKEMVCSYRGRLSNKVDVSDKQYHR